MRELLIGFVAGGLAAQGLRWGFRRIHDWYALRAWNKAGRPGPGRLH